VDTVGFAIPYGLVKWLGYSLVCYRAALRAFPADAVRERPGALVGSVTGAATVRTIVGLGIGMVLIRGGQAGVNPWVLLVVLLPIRFAEWLGVSWLFFQPLRLQRADLVRVAREGTVASYLLDIPGLILAALLGLAFNGIHMC